MGIKYSDFLIRGIDVSEFNEQVDWTKVQAHFTAIRAGHGRVTDKKFKVNWAGAKGKTYRIVYWYMDYYSHRDPTTTAYGISDVEWGKIQAEKCWSLFKDDPEGIVFLDIESASVADKKVQEVWPRVETIARAFYERIDVLTGWTNGLYASLGLLSAFSAWFRSRPLWVAWYNEFQTPETVLAAVKERGWKGKCLIWQYASHGDLDGDGSGDGLSMGMGYKFLDLNAWIGTDEDWKAFKGEQMTDILLNIEPLSQRDRRWSDTQLGTSNKTIGSHGCLITDATMLIRYLLGIGITPAELNTWLKANGGYQTYNLFLWSILNKYDSRISFGYRHNGAALDKIDDQLAKKMPVIVNVDMVPATPVLDEHWVLVLGKQDGSYIINDPWYGLIMPFEKNYGDPRTGVKIVCTYNFTGAVQPPVEPEPEGDVLFRVKVLIDNLLIRSTPEVKSTNILPGHAIFPGEYDVFEERNGYGRIGVNRWISMSPFYVQKLGGVPALSLEERVAKLEAWVEAHA